jgi:corrinoid protein of di/trimethylamine methyltransferase
MTMPEKAPSFEELAEAVIAGDAPRAARLAGLGLDGGLDPQAMIESGFIPGIRKVGDLWEAGDYFLPELMASAEAMKSAIAVLRPSLEASAAERLTLAKVVIGTIEGDIHDIGKNLVASMLAANGFDVVDLGADVKLERFIDAGLSNGADFICLSALLTTTMLGQRRLIEMLKDHGLRDRFKVLVGGAPVNQSWADQIGADGYGENALAAVRAARDLAPRKVRP